MDSLDDYLILAPTLIGNHHKLLLIKRRNGARNKLIDQNLSDLGDEHTLAKSMRFGDFLLSHENEENLWVGWNHQDDGLSFKHKKHVISDFLLFFFQFLMVMNASQILSLNIFDKTCMLQILVSFANQTPRFLLLPAKISTSF